MQMFDFGGYGSVWYHADAIANILLLSNVQKRLEIHYDSPTAQWDIFLRWRKIKERRACSGPQKKSFTHRSCFMSPSQGKSINGHQSEREREVVYGKRG